MIKSWLLKHWWVNELIKATIALILGLFGLVCWEGGKQASLDIVLSESYKLMIFGVVTGIMGTVVLFILIDMIYSITKHIKTKGKE